MMLKAFCRGLCGLSLVFTLFACASHVQPTEKLGEMSRDDFMNGMRWKRFNVSASFMQPEYRKDFLTTFADVKDIHITDIRLLDLQPFDENRRFDTTIEMDYYLLPSVTVKTFRFNQTWQFFDGENYPHEGYLIVTPFPEFP
jgi:hypothetical protein